MGFTSVTGIDFTLPGSPPLTAPPLSLPELSVLLLDTQGQVETARTAVEKAASAAQRLSDITYDLEAARASYEAAAQATPLELNDEGRDLPGAADSVADAARALEQLQFEYADAMAASVSAEAFSSDAAKRVAELSRWEHGLVYLPELSNADGVSTFVPDLGCHQARRQQPGTGRGAVLLVRPVRGRRPGRPVPVRLAPDGLSSPGPTVPRRALIGHEAWQVESEFWSGANIPTNYHLTASSDTPTTSPHRTIDAWPDPTPAPGTVLGTAVGLGQAMAALDQAIAESDAGTGMIHATPYVVQEFMRVYPFIRDPDGKVYTVNHNLLVPGYGYGGVGPDTASRTVTDGVTTSGDATFTSATAAFTSADIGRPLTDTTDAGDLAPGTYIVAITSGTEVVTSAPAVGSGTGLTVTIPGQGGRAAGAPQTDGRSPPSRCTRSAATSSPTRTTCARVPPSSPWTTRWPCVPSGRGVASPTASCGQPS